MVLFFFLQYFKIKWNLGFFLNFDIVSRSQSRSEKKKPKGQVHVSELFLHAAHEISCKTTSPNKYQKKIMETIEENLYVDIEV